MDTTSVAMAPGGWERVEWESREDKRATPTCFKFDWQVMRRDDSTTMLRAGKRSATRRPMIATTISMSVNPRGTRQEEFTTSSCLRELSFEAHSPIDSRRLE
jgi:hypothetical protein